MIRNILLVFTMLLLIGLSCQPVKKNKFKVYSIEQKKAPQDILRLYLEKVGLDDLGHPIDGVEFRKWYPFYYIDSFPVVLQRIYLKKGKVSAECYLFSDKDGGLITSINEVGGLKAQKFSITNIPYYYFDSLLTTYDLTKIYEIDFSKIDSLSKTDFLSEIPRKIFLQRADSVSKYEVFIANPELYKTLNDPNINKCANISKYFFNVLNRNDTGFYNWLGGNGQRIVGVQ